MHLKKKTHNADRFIKHTVKKDYECNRESYFQCVNPIWS